MAGHWQRVCTIALFAASLLASSPTTANALKTANYCETAAVQAAQVSKVPLDVLRAISLTETGRTKQGSVRPWPWTVNMEGTGKWFDDQAAALAYVKRAMKRGAVSFDVGCFQINYRWHGQAFASVEEMFDPTKNAVYAAGFLSELFDEFGDWTKAAGAYHSRTPKYAERYRARFSKFRAALGAPVQPQSLEPASPQPPKRVTENRFPFLRATGLRSETASLVPLSERAPRRLIDIANQ